MAADTEKTLRNKVMYQIFVRNFKRSAEYRIISNDSQRRFHAKFERSQSSSEFHALEDH